MVESVGESRSGDEGCGSGASDSSGEGGHSVVVLEEEEADGTSLGSFENFGCFGNDEEQVEAEDEVEDDEEAVAEGE